MNPYDNDSIEYNSDKQERYQEQSNFNTERRYANPPDYEFNTSSLRHDPEVAAKSLERTFTQLESMEERAALTAKAKNAAFFANYLHISPEKAWDMHDQLTSSVFPREMLSSETFAGRVSMVYKQKSMEQEIAMLRFNQMNGDSSEGTENRILMLKAGQPSTSELDRIMEELGDEHKDFGSKVVEAFKGTPYMLTSQAPMWISQARHGLAVGAAGAGTGFALGTIGAPVTAVTGGIAGFIAGGARYEYMMESGLAYDDMLTQAAEAGVKLDPKIARESAKISAALITAVDYASLAFGGKAVLGGATKAVGAGIKEVTKESTKKILMAMMLDVGKATAGEALGEGSQEAIGGISRNLAFALNEEIGNGHIDPKTATEIWKDATVAMIMASTTALVASGAGASFTATKNITANKATVKTEAKIADTYRLSKLTPEEIKAETGKEFSKETTPEAIQQTLEGEIRSKTGFEFSVKGVVPATLNDFWANVSKRYHISTPLGISIKEKFKVSTLGSDGIRVKSSFSVTQKAGKTIMTGEVGDFETQSSLFNPEDFQTDYGELDPMVNSSQGSNDEIAIKIKTGDIEKYKVGLESNKKGLAKELAREKPREREIEYYENNIFSRKEDIKALEEEILEHKRKAIDEKAKRKAMISGNEQIGTIPTGDKKTSNLQVKATVFQGEFGLDLEFDQEYAPNSVQGRLAAQMRRKMHEMTKEGQIFDVKSLNISEQMKSNMLEMEEMREILGTARMSELKNNGIAAFLIEISHELYRHKEGSEEYKALTQMLYEYGRLDVEWKSKGQGLYGVVERVLSMLQSKTFSRARNAQLRSIMEEKYDTTILSKEDVQNIEKIHSKLEKNRNYTLRNDEKILLEREKMKKPENLSYNDLDAMVREMEHIAVVAEEETKVKFGPFFIPLSKAMANSTLDVKNGALKHKVTDQDPYDVGKQSVAKKLLDGAKKMALLDQTQYHWVIAHLAGEESIVNEILYRRLKETDMDWADLKHDLQDSYHNDIVAAGINPREMWDWGNRKKGGFVEVDGIKFSKGQGLAALMHSRNERNRINIANKGMKYKNDQGTLISISGETILKLAKEMENDPMAIQLAALMKLTFARLAPKISAVYSGLYKQELILQDDYYPGHVAPDQFQKDAVDVYSITKDEDNLTTVKNFLYEQKSENVALMLNSAFDDITQSIEQESKFITKEMALFNAESLLNDNDFRAAVTEALGEEYLKNIREGIKASAGYQPDHGHVLDRPLMKLRNNFVRATIGLNPFVAMKAPISWAYGMQYIQPEYMFKGLSANMLESGKRNVEYLMERSSGFRERVANGGLAETSDLFAGKSAERFIKSGGSLKTGTATYDDVLFGMIKFADKHTVSAVMTGAVLQARAEFASGKLSQQVRNATGYVDSLVPRMTMEMKEAAAIAFGEYVMDRSQPSFNPLNRNAFQRGSAIERFFSVYGSFTTVTHNMMMHSAYLLRTEGASAAKPVAINLGLWAITSLQNVGVNQARNYLTGREPDPAWEWVIQAMFGNIFVVRDLVNSGISKAKYGIVGNTSAVPIDEILTKTGDAAYFLITGSGINGGEYDGEKVLKGFRILSTVAAKASGIPATPITLPMQVIEANMDEDSREEWKLGK